MKRYVAILGALMFCVVCFSLYLMMESAASISPGQVAAMEENDLSGIEAKIKRIETDLQRNHKTINLIKDTVRDIANGDTESLNRLQKALERQGADLFLPGERGKGKSHGHVFHMEGRPAQIHHVNVSGGLKVPVAVSQDMCALAQKGSPKPDIQMMDVFESLPFDNPDGGVWKQGWPLIYDESSFINKPLKVFLVPHSHTDPGWLKTFERYYTDQTKKILDTMVDKLETYPEMKFVYAEMSFFSRWWGEINTGKQEQVLKLIKDKRLEIMTGGWVMTDEANAHYYAMLDQMIEGNQWLLNTLDVKPKSGWAIDPFGHSPTMAYLLKRMGFDNMLIQRVHYAVKKHLAKNKALEFMWQQNWDHTGDTGMFCHMMPFYSYDVPHSCGPDPKVCCQFDFKRLPGGRISCPWKVPPSQITDHNVAERAKVILDQWKKKSTLYRNGVVLVPLGDDFRYDKGTEWDQQYQNYKKLMDYMNTRSDWNVEAKFGTLSDYFEALRERAGSTDGRPPQGYPSLSGDFFTYADRDDHYWSGYFTSRPFYKRLDRVLEDHLRGAEILYSQALAYVRRFSVKSFPESNLMRQIVGARRGLGLFQHHDGITGTAKDAVVVDYGMKLLTALMDMKDVIRQSSAFLLTKDKASYRHPEITPFLDIDEMRESHDSLPVLTVMSLTFDARPVVLYNSLGHTRQTVVRLHVNTPHLELRDSLDSIMNTQVNPVLTDSGAVPGVFEVVFVARIPPLGLSRYQIKKVSANQNSANQIAVVTMYNTAKDVDTNSKPFRVDKKEIEEDFTIENDELKVSFSGKTGMIMSVLAKESGLKVETAVRFMVYNVGNARERSGAYLFLPPGSSHPLEYQKPLMRIIRGPIMSEAHISIKHVQQIVSLCTSPGVDSLGLDIVNLVDIRHETNYELVMQVQTSVENEENEFYSDLNGFQVQRRRTHKKLKLQGNFYPMPTMAYIQDSRSRFSILSGQSLGVASLFKGQLEIVQDRTLNQDDNRGLGQGVTDNKQTPNIFRFLIEPRKHFSRESSKQPAGYPSLVAHMLSRELIYPVMVMPAAHTPNPPSSSQLLTEYQPLTTDLPCELHLVNLRTLQNPEKNPVMQFVPRDVSALMLHHVGSDCSLPIRGLTCPTANGKVTLANIFSDISLSGAVSSSLSLIHDGKAVNRETQASVPAMEIVAYKVKLT